MNYYKATFRKSQNPDAHHSERRFDWFDLICRAANYEEARSHAMHVASDNDMAFCTIQRMDRAQGKKENDERFTAIVKIS